MLFPVQKLMNSLHARSGTSFDIQLADGSRYRAGPGEPAFTVLFRSDAALLQAFSRGHLALLEAYFAQRIHIEGDLGAALAAGMLSGLDVPTPLLKVENRLHEYRHSNRSAAQAKANARAHYGLGTEFYRLWLDDPLMMYTCGYWLEGTRTLEEAQQAKIDHVCRKIQLSRGERYIDIGCGFGGFLFRAWEKVGALGTGLNITTEQIEWLRREVASRDLKDKIEVIEADFREVGAQYDKVVSIGVLEHAGRDQLAEVVRAHANFLRPGGLGVLHFIGHISPRETDLFIRKHVFPGGWIPALSEVIVEMERCGLEVVDIENLRRHYALTLDVWAERFEKQWETIRGLDPQRFDEHFYRVWRTYLRGCAEMFRSSAGYTHLFQIVFSKGNVTKDNYPMSRAHLYGC